MKYDVISADGHVDLIWLPPDLFTRNASANLKDRMPHVIDGPKGPAEVVGMGAIKLAQQMEAPIVVYGLSAQGRKLKSWDRLLFPRLAGRLLVIGLRRGGGGRVAPQRQRIEGARRPIEVAGHVERELLGPGIVGGGEVEILAVPVEGRKARLTNLSWTISEAARSSGA